MTSRGALKGSDELSRERANEREHDSQRTTSKRTLEGTHISGITSPRAGKTYGTRRRTEHSKVEGSVLSRDAGRSNRSMGHDQ